MTGFDDVTAAVDAQEGEDPLVARKALNRYGLRDQVSVLATREATGGGSFATVTCVLEAFPLDIHDIGSHPCKWTGLFNNPQQLTPLLAIPAGLGLTFSFDGSSETVTATEAGTWAFTISFSADTDATFAGQVVLDAALPGVGANLPTPPVGVSLMAAVTEVVSWPSGSVASPFVYTVAQATADPLNADVYLTIVRLA